MKFFLEKLEMKLGLSGSAIARKIGIPQQRYHYYKFKSGGGERLTQYAKFLFGIYKLSGLRRGEFLDEVLKDDETKET